MLLLYWLLYLILLIFINFRVDLMEVYLDFIKCTDCLNPWLDVSN